MTEEWKGSVDELEMYDHPLTPGEIAQMTYAERVRALEPIVYWPGPFFFTEEGQKMMALSDA